MTRHNFRIQKNRDGTYQVSFRYGHGQHSEAICWSDPLPDKAAAREAIKRIKDFAKGAKVVDTNGHEIASFMGG